MIRGEVNRDQTEEEERLDGAGGGEPDICSRIHSKRGNDAC